MPLAEGQVGECGGGKFLPRRPIRLSLEWATPGLVVSRTRRSRAGKACALLGPAARPHLGVAMRPIT